VSSVTPSAEQAAALAQLPKDVPIVMINLLAFKQPDGERSYARYAADVQVHLQRVRARVLYLGEQRQMVVGADRRAWWDSIIVVEYPSIDAFFAMVADSDYQSVHGHREAGLERAELIATVHGMPHAVIQASTLKAVR
jgi:uncharacterized protein (DUF1330 family)